MKGLSRLRVPNPVLQDIKACLLATCLERFLTRVCYSTRLENSTKNIIFSVKKIPWINKSQAAKIQYFAPPPEPKDIEWPKERRLKPVPKVPTSFPTVRPRTMERKLSLMRGPEPVHNFLIYKQCGLQALTGGRMEAKHFEFFRQALMHKFDYNQAFALWRVDPPWQAVSKKGSGKKMGGGKSPIHHYCTPIKAGRIILEVGGTLHPLEFQKKLAPLAENLPFPARYVTQEMLEQEKKDKKWQEENNQNPYTFKYVILNNMGGCNNWLSKYDYKWFGEYK